MQQQQQQLGSALWPFVAFTLLLNCGGFIGQNVAEAKATNITYNWSLPQEGFPVFYRFFRDKISWYEADAVCQFNHGNLVTVNTGQQFDASRAFLRELDVNGVAWIGLRGSSGSGQFTWANSQPLDHNAGYWAESFPSTESALCAAIDPARNFRWHALQCNSNTAAFLCELPVPEWGQHCTAVTGLPSVTIQYLSDVAAIRLSRDCGDEEGEKHVLCRAGEDRAFVLSQLSCGVNGVGGAAVASSSTEGDLYATSDESVYTSTATSEEDSAVVSATTTRSGMDSAINKIVTEIQSIATNDTLNGELEPLKPRKQPKKYAAQEVVAKKYKKYSLEMKEKRIPTEETPPTDELLPRVKKMRPEDLLKHEERVRRETLNIPMSTVEESTMSENFTTSSSSLADEEILFATTNGTEDSLVPVVTTLDEDFDWSNSTDLDAESPSPSPAAISTAASEQVQQTTPTIAKAVEMLEISGTPHSAQPKGSITHPMHISSDMTKELNDVNPQQQKKMTVNQQDHFVPPLLLAKFSTGKQQSHADVHENVTTASDGNGPDAAIHNTLESPMTDAANDISKFYPASTVKTIINNAAGGGDEEENKILVEIPEGNATQPTIITTIKVGDNLTTDFSTTSPEPQSSAATPITTTTTAPVTAAIEELPAAAAPKAPQYHSEFSFNNAENFHPYRPNRRRSLTRQASHSFLRRILG